MKKTTINDARNNFKLFKQLEKDNQLDYDKYIYSKEIEDDIMFSFGLLKNAGLFEYDLHIVQLGWVLDYLRSKSRVYYFLGMRKCGKSEILTQFTTAFLLSKFPSLTFMIFCRNEKLASNNVYIISQMLKILGVQLVRSNASGVRTRMNLENDMSVIALSIETPLKGYHTDFAILDDALDSNDRYSDRVKDRVVHVKNQVVNASKRQLIVGQLVAYDDFYVQARADYYNQLERFRAGNYHENPDEGGTVVKEFWLVHAKAQMPEVQAFSDFNEELQIRNTGYEDFCMNYAGIIPTNSINNPLSNSQVVAEPRVIDSRVIMCYIDPAKGGGDFTSISYLMIAMHEGQHKLFLLNYSLQEHWSVMMDNMQASNSNYYKYLSKANTVVVEENSLGLNDCEKIRHMLKGVTVLFDKAHVNKFQRIAEGVQIIRNIGNGMVVCETSSNELFTEFSMYEPLKPTSLKHDDALDATAGLFRTLFSRRLTGQMLIEMKLVRHIVAIDELIKRSEVGVAHSMFYA